MATIDGDALFTRMERVMPELRNAASAEKTRSISHLADAQEELVTEVNSLDADILLKSATVVTVADQRRYSLPSDYDGDRFAEYVRDDSTDDTIELDPLQYIADKDRYQNLDGSWLVTASTASGSPAGYLIFGEFLQIIPIPDAVYTVRMWYQPRQTAIAASVNTSLPQALWQSLVLKACIAERIYRHMEFTDLQFRLDRALALGMARLGDWHDHGARYVNYIDDHEV